MATKVRQGYDILKNFAGVEIYPDEDLSGSEIVDLVETYGCSHATLIPFPPSEDSEGGGLVLFASPYPVSIEEAKELFAEWSAAIERGVS